MIGRRYLSGSRLTSSWSSGRSSITETRFSWSPVATVLPRAAPCCSWSRRRAARAGSDRDPHGHLVKPPRQGSDGPGSCPPSRQDQKRRLERIFGILERS